MNFKKQKEIKVKAKATKKYRKTKALVFFLICLVVIALGYLMTAIIVEYKDTHSFNYQSPIVFQKPVIIKRNMTIISPISTQSGMMKAYAQEVKNPYDIRSPKGIAYMAVKAKWGIEEWGSFEELITNESHFNPYAVNQSSGAKGMFQSLGHKDYNCEGWEIECQVTWGINYISQRYGTPSNAMAFWNENGWY